MSDLMNMTVTMGQVGAVIELVLSVLLCFFGYKMMKQLMALCGFLLGFLLGYEIVLGISGMPAYAPLLAGVVCGILLAVLSYRLYKFGVFLYAGFLAGSAVYQLPYFASMAYGKYIAFGCALLAFILVGWLAVKFARTILILVTGISGGFMTVNALYVLWPALAGFGLSLLIYQLILAAAGLTFQFITGK
jgi:hypothetical protein